MADEALAETDEAARLVRSCEDYAVKFAALLESQNP